MRVHRVKPTLRRARRPGEGGRTHRPPCVRWGALVGAHPQFPVDMLIVASALEHSLTVVTRNEAHIRVAGAPVVNPFQRR